VKRKRSWEVKRSSEMIRGSRHPKKNIQNIPDQIDVIKTEEKSSVLDKIKKAFRK